MDSIENTSDVITKTPTQLYELMKKQVNSGFCAICRERFMFSDCYTHYTTCFSIFKQLLHDIFPTSDVFNDSKPLYDLNSSYMNNTNNPKNSQPNITTNKNNPTVPTITDSETINIVPIEPVIQQKELEPELTQSEINEIKIKVSRSNLIVGERWCPTNIQWFNKLVGGYSRDEIGVIDNSSLLQPDGDMLRTGLLEGIHFILLPEPIYLKLKAVYGGGPDIYRKVIKGPYSSNIVDLKIPISLKFCKSSEPTRIVDGYALKSELIANIKERMCKFFGLVPLEVKIWDYYNNKKNSELKNLEYVSNTNLLGDQLILLEEKNADGTWPQDINRPSHFKG